MILSDGSIVRVDGNELVLIEEGAGEEVRAATVSHSFTVDERMFEEWIGRNVVDNEDFNEFVSVIEEHLTFIYDKDLVNSVSDIVNITFQERKLGGN
jgi:hypothetical protein